MGAAESKPDLGGSSSRDQDEQEKKRRGESSSSMGSGTAALAAGAAVGAALLGVAWGVSRYGSNDSKEVGGYHHDLDSPPESPRGTSGVSQYRSNNTFVLEGYRHGHDLHPKSTIPNSFQNLRIADSYSEPESTLKILTYNVCSRKDYYETDQRMQAIGALVERYTPDFICFQEFTPEIYNMFRESNWWEDYYSSMSDEEAREKQYFCILLSKFHPGETIKEPLGTSKMGRELCVIRTKVGNKSLVVATSHLKSPCPDPKDPSSQYHQFKRERSFQAKTALTILQRYRNVIFCGDMNWNEKEDGEFPLPKGWVDAWTVLKSAQKGYTFDTKLNEMLKNHPRLRMRLDRIVCNLTGFRLDNIDIIGKEAIPDVTYQRYKKPLPVLPSDHFGLLLTIRTTEDSGT